VWQQQQQQQQQDIMYYRTVSATSTLRRQSSCMQSYLFNVIGRPLPAAFELLISSVTEEQPLPVLLSLFKGLIRCKPLSTEHC